MAAPEGGIWPARGPAESRTPAGAAVAPTWAGPLPLLGAGLAHRPQFDRALADGVLRAEWLEIITEHYLDAPPEELRRLAELGERYPLVPHGLELSIGSPDGADEGYVRAVAGLVAELGAPWFSDHLCFTHADGVALGTLLPLPRTRAVAQRVARNADAVAAAVGVPLLLENITYHLDLGGELSEAEFVSEVLAHSDCGLLLDVTNVHTNAVNHGYDAVEFLDALPAGRIGQLHLAGGELRDGVLRDSHSEPVPDEVWALLEHLLATAAPAGLVVERDENFRSAVADVAADLDRAGDLLRRSRAAAW